MPYGRNEPDADFSQAGQIAMDLLHQRQPAPGNLSDGNLYPEVFRGIYKSRSHGRRSYRLDQKRDVWFLIIGK